jgi:hypothetical protein
MMCSLVVAAPVGMPEYLQPLCHPGPPWVALKTLNKNNELHFSRRRRSEKTARRLSENHQPASNWQPSGNNAQAR